MQSQKSKEPAGRLPECSRMFPVLSILRPSTLALVESFVDSDNGKLWCCFTTWLSAWRWEAIFIAESRLILSTNDVVKAQLMLVKCVLVSTNVAHYYSLMLDLWMRSGCYSSYTQEIQVRPVLDNNDFIGKCFIFFLSIFQAFYTKHRPVMNAPTLFSTCEIRHLGVGQEAIAQVLPLDSADSGIGWVRS